MEQRMVVRHEWAPGTRVKAEAEAAAAQLAALTERDGALHLDAVIVANEPEDAPLHEAFEWDNEAAAHMYRLGQAGHAVRSIRRVVVNLATEEEEPAERIYIPRKVVTTRQAGDESQSYTYVPIVLAGSDDDQANRLRMHALTRLEKLVTEFQTVPQLMDIAGDLSDLLMKYSTQEVLA